MSAKKAVVLLSGGLDSATTLALAKEAGFRLYALSFHYGQRHASELGLAKKMAAAFGVEDHVIMEINLRTFGGSALTSDLEVPKNRPQAESAPEIPITYVPARNTIFLSFALGWAEVLEAEDIFIGVNAVDYSGYPDCRREFIEAFQHLARLATRAGVEGRQALTIHTPLINLSKAEIIRTGLRLGVNLAETVSCYDADDAGYACGACDSCILRRNGFAEATLPDPTRYRTQP